MHHWLIAVAVVLAAALILAAHIGRLESHIVEHIDRQVNHLRKAIIVSAQDTVNAAVAQIRRGTQEVLGRIAELQEQVDAGTPVDDLDLSELTAAAQALDDIVADAPADVPADEPPADVPGDDVDGGDVAPVDA